MRNSLLMKTAATVLTITSIYSTPTFASKARVNALGKAAFLVDIQGIFDNPSYITQIPEYVTLEFGPSNATGANYSSSEDYLLTAEGGFSKSSGSKVYGFYLGRRNNFTQAYRAQMGMPKQDNPIEFTYGQKGELSWGAALNYSSSNNKTAGTKQESYGVRVGATTSVWSAGAVIGLNSKVDGNTATSFATGTGLWVDANDDGSRAASEVTALAADRNSSWNGTPGFQLEFKYKLDSLTPYIKYFQDGYKYDSSVNTSLNGLEVARTSIQIGAVDTVKSDDGVFFYGAELKQTTMKITKPTDYKKTAIYLPVLMGIEAPATSWMTFRTSLSQNVLYSSKKVEVAGSGETDTVGNDTKVAVGTGLKFAKWNMDNTLEGSSTGDLNLTNLFLRTSLTYNF